MAAYKIMGTHVKGYPVELAHEYSLERAIEYWKICTKNGTKTDGIKMYDISNGGCKEMDISKITNKSNGGNIAIGLFLVVLFVLVIVNVGTLFSILFAGIVIGLICLFKK